MTTYFLYAIWKIIWNFLGIFGRNYLKIFWKNFHISCTKFLFKLIFLESFAENIGNGYFHYIQIWLRFVSSLFFILWIILFQTKLRFDRNASKPPFIQNQKKIITPKLAKLVSQPMDRVKFNKLTLWKKISLDVLKFSFCFVFFQKFKFLILT